MKTAIRFKRFLGFVLTALFLLSSTHLWGRDWQRRSVRIPPFYWAEYNEDNQTSLRMVLLLYWRTQGTDESFRLLFPFYMESKNPKKTIRVFPPIGMSIRSPEKKLDIWGPFYRRDTPSDKTRALFPLFYKRQVDEREMVLSPLYLKFRREDSEWGVFPPYVWKKSPFRKTQVLFPLYWRFQVEESVRTIIPPYYRFVHPSGHTTGLFPVFKHLRNEDYHEGWFFPLYFLTKEGSESSFFSLLFSRRKSLETGSTYHFGPFIWGKGNEGGKTHSLIPLYYWQSRPHGKTFWSGPFYHNRDGEESVQWFLPFYIYKKNDLETKFYSLPLYLKRDDRQTTGFSLLYYWHRSNEGRQRDVVLPLFWSFRKNGKEFTTLFPFYWKTNLAVGKAKVIAPFFFRFTKGEEVTTIIPPIIVKKSPTKKRWSAFFIFWRDKSINKDVTTLFPLFHYSHSETGRHFISPLLWRYREGTVRRGIIPPYYYSRHAKGGSDVIFPFYWSFRSPKKRLDILIPFWRQKGENLSRGGFFPLVWYETRPLTGVYKRSVLPFWRFSREGLHYRSWSIPILLSSYERGIDSSGVSWNAGRILLYSFRNTQHMKSRELIPLFTYKSGKESYSFRAPTTFPLFILQREGNKSRKLIPPFYQQKGYGTDITLFFPLYTRWGKGKKDTVVIPPYFRKKTEDSSLTSIFPMYWHSKNPVWKTTILFPLLYRSWDTDGTQSTLLTPLFFLQRDGETRRGWGLNFIWSQGPKEGFRVGFPLYYSRYTESKKDTVIFPLFWRSKGKKTVLVIPPFFSVRDSQSKTTGIAPFYSFTRYGPKNWYLQILGRLFAIDVQGGRKQYTFLFFFNTSP